MKKLMVLLVFLMAVGFATAYEEQILDDISPGSSANWNAYTSGYSPALTFEEITSPYDGGTAFKTSVSGNTLMECDTKYIYKVFDVGEHKAGSSYLKAYLEFSYDGTYYNFPYVQVSLLDASNNVVGYHLWYGKGVVGGLYQSYIAADPTSYTELSSDKGYFELQLSDIPGNLEYSKIQVTVSDYTCIGNNYVIFDKLSFHAFNSNGESGGVGSGGGSIPEQTIPEFGVVAAFVAIFGAFAVFMFIRKQ